jgi:hypothetical protein
MWAYVYVSVCFFVHLCMHVFVCMCISQLCRAEDYDRELACMRIYVRMYVHNSKFWLRSHMHRPNNHGVCIHTCERIFMNTYAYTHTHTHVQATDVDYASRVCGLTSPAVPAITNQVPGQQDIKITRACGVSAKREGGREGGREGEREGEG